MSPGLLDAAVVVGGSFDRAWAGPVPPRRDDLGGDLDRDLGQCVSFPVLRGKPGVPVAVFSVANTTWTENALTWNNKPASGATALATATRPEQMGSLPGVRFHPLKGDRKGQWAVSVSGNWRLVFAFEDEDATDVDLVDYH